MTFPIRRALGSLAAAGLAGAALLVTGAAVHAGTIPPWEPDRNSVGGLLFFDSSGNQITGGSINDDPIAAYVQGTSTIRSGDTKATLYGYLPKSGQQPGQFSGEILGGPSVYPNSAAPAPLAGSPLPLETGSAIDLTVADLAADYPNTDTSSDGYAGLYQLRLLTTQAGQAGNTTYDSADILITGNSWSVAYTKQSTVTTHTTLSVTPATAAFHGAKVKLSASVSPSAAAGSVVFLDGTKQLKKVALSGGKATYSTTALADGTHKLRAKFVPSDAQAFGASKSTVHTLVVKAHPTTTTLKASKTSVAKGAKVTLTAAETPTAAGKFVIKDGAAKLATVTAKKGTASFSTTKLAVGTHTLTATFVPSSSPDFASSTSKAVKVKVTK